MEEESFDNIYKGLQERLDCNNSEKTPSKEFEFQKYDSTKSQLRTLEALVKSKSGESQLHEFLEQNKNIFAFALQYFHTGNHAAYVFSKQQILPKINGVAKGLIPDFIVGGQNSDGIQWWIVELKGADEHVFVEDSSNDLRFSSTLNKGICQLLRYIDTCSEIQAQLRDTFKMTNFREPRGLIIVGTEEEFLNNTNKQKLKAAWNRSHPKNLEIRTYDWLLRMFKDNDKAFNFAE